MVWRGLPPIEGSDFQRMPPDACSWTVDACADAGAVFRLGRQCADLCCDPRALIVDPKRIETGGGDDMGANTVNALSDLPMPIAGRMWLAANVATMVIVLRRCQRPIPAGQPDDGHFRSQGANERLPHACGHCPGHRQGFRYPGLVRVRSGRHFERSAAVGDAGAGEVPCAGHEAVVCQIGHAKRLARVGLWVLKPEKFQESFTGKT